MTYDIINIPAGQWTLVSTDTVNFQVQDDREVSFTQSASLPTHGVRQNSFTAIPGNIYRVQSEQGNLYMYPQGAQGANIAIGAELNGVYIENAILDVSIQDQTTPPFDLYFARNLTDTTLAVDAVYDTRTITVTSAVGITVGNYIGIFDSNQFYFGYVLSIAGNVLTLDSPLDFDFPAASPVTIYTSDMNVNGSVTRQIYRIGPIGPGYVLEIDITRILVQMFTANVVGLNRFGDIVGGLTNGIVLRRVNGNINNIWNVKNNGDFAQLSYDYREYSASNPVQGVNGLSCRYTFNGLDKHGVVVRLREGDALELIIQDDLSTITRFRMMAQGHVVQP